MDREQSVMENTVEKEWLDLAGLTRYAAVSQRTLRDWIHRDVNPLPAVRVGTKILIRRSKFDRWLESHRLVPSESIDVTATVEQIINDLTGKN
jgi:excisionase family DNA binding protein